MPAEIQGAQYQMYYCRDQNSDVSANLMVKSMSIYKTIPRINSPLTRDKAK